MLFVISQFKVTEPLVPPPLIPVPATTAVISPTFVVYPAPFVNWLLLVIPFVIVTVSVELLVVILMLVPAAKVNVSLLLSATTVFCPDTAIFLNMFCEDPLSELVIVTDPEVPPPLIPVPALTAVISPCGTANEVDSVPPSCCVKVKVTVDEPLSLKPVIILSYALFHSPELPPLAIIFPVTVKWLPLAFQVIPESLANVVAPLQYATLFAAPAPSNTDVLSILSHVSVAPASTNTAQSPTFQSVMPSKFVEPATETM